MRDDILLQQKVQRLREIESYAYQSAYYILMDEGRAAEAASLALLEISKHSAFMNESTEGLKLLLKKQVIRAALCPI